MSIIEFEEWQVYFRMKAERIDQEIKSKMKPQKGPGAAAGVDTDPPAMGSSGKRGRKRP